MTFEQISHIVFIWDDGINEKPINLSFDEIRLSISCVVLLFLFLYSANFGEFKKQNTMAMNNVINYF